MTGFSMDFVEAVARQRGLAKASRYELWLDQLNTNAPVIDDLYDAPVPDSQEPVDVARLVDRRPRRRWSAGRPLAAETDCPEEDSAYAIAESVRRQRVTATSRVEQALRTAERDRHLHAFTAVFAEHAQAEAERIDERIRRGEDVGPLAGLTVAVKDLMQVRGHATTAGTRAWQTAAAERDAECVARLRRAGAIVLGTANLHALAYGVTSTNPDYGRVGNPHHEQAFAGGSSGGSAAAVAAGIADVALGTDTSGSVRIPASCCGVVGVKPTYGRVSTHGVDALGPSMDHVGPLTRTVEDSARMLAVLSPRAFRAAETAWRDLAGVTVGVPRTYFTDHLSAEVRSALEECVAAIASCGGQVVDVDVPSATYVPAGQLLTLGVEAAEVHRELVRERGPMLPDDVRLRLETGMFFSGTDYRRAQRLRGMIRADLDRALGRVDVVLTPTLATTVPDADTEHVGVDGVEWTTRHALSRLTMAFNLTGHPAVSVPWGRDGRGVPIGMQIAGRPMEEAAVLGAARVVEGLAKP